METKLDFSGSPCGFLDAFSSLLGDLTIVPTTVDNAPLLLPVLAGNVFFSTISEGRPAILADVTDCIEATPPGFPREGKLFFGLFDGDSPAAVVDILLGYPDENTLWLGLLEVDKSRQGMGLGRRVMSAMEGATKASGMAAIHLAVLNNNAPGRAFWYRMGFSPLRESVIEHDDGKPTWRLIVMGKKLCS